MGKCCSRPDALIFDVIDDITQSDVYDPLISKEISNPGGPASQSRGDPAFREISSSDFDNFVRTLVPVSQGEELSCPYSSRHLGFRCIYCRSRAPNTT